MCGIVGYTGYEEAEPVIIDGLKRLEYRGYDSAGVAIQNAGSITVRKKWGKIADLEKLIGDEKLPGTAGIGHTRWATHGAPNDINSHPHLSANGDVAVVHNGIVENYVGLRDELTEKYGLSFYSETDTEVIAKLIGLLYEENGCDLKAAVHSAVSRLKGTFAIAVVADNSPGEIVAYRKDAPLIAGVGNGCKFVASDIPALLKYVNDVILIENDEMVDIKPDEIKIYDRNMNEVRREIMKITWSVEDAEKGGFDHFMLKEINDQPKAVKETLERRIGDDGKIRLDGISLTKEDLENTSRIYIVACGTAYHAGLVGKAVIEKMTRIPVEVDVASEFRYRDPIMDDHTLFIAISQSGETQDTLAALREAKASGARVLSVVNVVGSSVARESDDVFYTWAGPEIAVASTKAYTTQLVCMYLIALYMGDLLGTVTRDYYDHILSELKEMPVRIEKILKNSDLIEKSASRYYDKDQIFFIGRGLDASVAYEGSLKLKEISYINSFAIAAGELKHGTIALMEPETLVIALATQDALFEKIFSNIKEIKARHAIVNAVAKEGRSEITAECPETFFIPDCDDEVTPILTVIPLQLFAYYVAKFKGEDIDKPRNLAKSVTVE